MIVNCGKTLTRSKSCLQSYQLYKTTLMWIIKREKKPTCCFIYHSERTPGKLSYLPALTMSLSYNSDHPFLFHVPTSPVDKTHCYQAQRSNQSLFSLFEEFKRFSKLAILLLISVIVAAEYPCCFFLFTIRIDELLPGALPLLILFGSLC